jgi:opacity protein-like surface antigen
MKRINIVMMVVLILAGSITAHAQKGELKLDVNYSVGFPLGTYKDLMKDHSYKGWQANLLYGINDRFSIGLGTGLQDFYNKVDRKIYNTGDGQISAVVSNSIQTVPILLTGRYQFNNDKAIQPYASLGVGGNMIMYSQYLGEFGDNQNSFGFAVRPELGVFVPFRKGGDYGFQVGGNFNYMPYKKNGLENLNHASVFAGIRLPLRGD